jgi:hypothetical protein
VLLRRPSCSKPFDRFSQIVERYAVSGGGVACAEMAETYTSGTWTVKPGQDDAFIREWDRLRSLGEQDARLGDVPPRSRLGPSRSVYEFRAVGEL